jgi:hypothetical protein
MNIGQLQNSTNVAIVPLPGPCNGYAQQSSTASTSKTEAVQGTSKEDKASSIKKKWPHEGLQHGQDEEADMSASKPLQLQ